jgi:hypothetical protein
VIFYGFLKLKKKISGIGTAAYGLGGLLLYTHSEFVKTDKGEVEIFFWYKENRSSPH